MTPDGEHIAILLVFLAFSAFFAYAGLINPRIWVQSHGSKDQKRRIKDFQLAHDEVFVMKCRLSGAAATICVLVCLYGLYLSLKAL